MVRIVVLPKIKNMCSDGSMAKRRARRDKLLAGMAKLFKELDNE